MSLKWRDDGDGCFALINKDNVIIAAFGPDKSKEGWFRGFAFDPETSAGTHEAIWPDEKDIRKDIESWFDVDGKLKPYAERNQDSFNKVKLKE